MNIWLLILLCVVQGMTEFLPVSSSGHLIFVEQLFAVTENVMFINLFLHLSTLLAVIIIYRKIIWKIAKKPFQPLTFKLLIATMFSVVLAVLYKILRLENVETNIYPFAFLVTSIILFLCHLFQKKSVGILKNEIGFNNALLVGLVQGVAVVPGLSRSGSTISSLILSGNSEQKASEFSFLLSIPIIIGGFVLEVFEMNKARISLDFFDINTCIFAFVLTFVVSIFALKLTIKLLKKQKFIVFSVYTFMMFLVTFIYNFLM